MDEVIMEKLFAIKDISLVFVAIQIIFVSRIYFPKFWFFLKDMKYSQKYENYDYEHDYNDMKKLSKITILVASVIYVALVTLAFIES